MSTCAVSLISSDYIIFTLQAPTICAATVQHVQAAPDPLDLYYVDAHICSAHSIPLAGWLISQNYLSVTMKFQINSLSPQIRPE